MEKEIHKQTHLTPNLPDYKKAYKGFQWEAVRTELGLVPPVNIASKAVDQHARSWRRNKVALYWEGAEGQNCKYTFYELQKESNRIGNMLLNLGVRRGDRVFVFLQDTRALHQRHWYSQD